MFDDYYKILGVDPRADQDALKKAYRLKSWEAHPDRGGSAEGMKKINEAWTILSSGDLRAIYDRTRVGTGTSAKTMDEAIRKDRQEAEEELWRYMNYHNRMNPGVAQYYADPKKVRAKKIQKHFGSFFGMLKILLGAYTVVFLLIVVFYYIFVEPVF